MLHCKVLSHWLGTYTKWSLILNNFLFTIWGHSKCMISFGEIWLRFNGLRQVSLNIPWNILFRLFIMHWGYFGKVGNHKNGELLLQVTMCDWFFFSQRCRVISAIGICRDLCHCQIMFLIQFNWLEGQMDWQTANGCNRNIASPLECWQMSIMVPQINNNSTVCSTICLRQRKHQNPCQWPFVRWMQWW